MTKLERSKRGPGGGLRGSRSHESLLSSHAVMSTIGKNFYTYRYSKISLWNISIKKNEIV